MHVSLDLELDFFRISANKCNLSDKPYIVLFMYRHKGPWLLLDPGHIDIFVHTYINSYLLGPF